mmetsp:Transcript_7264/g.15547  ORF Transcript_7264/g.15547 Transcript_7264/m.15547 type:complete len:130 (-) Transcript_7264:15-404(-)
MTNGSESIRYNSNETVDNPKLGKIQQESHPTSSTTSCATTPSLDLSSRLRNTLNSLEVGSSNCYPTESTPMAVLNQQSDHTNDDYDENDVGGLTKNGNDFWSYNTRNNANGYQHQHHRLRTILIFLVAG